MSAPPLEQGFALRAGLCRMLAEARRPDAIGAAVSFLLEAQDSAPQVLRRVLNTTVERPGARPCRIIDVLARAAHD